MKNNNKLYKLLFIVIVLGLIVIGVVIGIIDTNKKVGAEFKCPEEYSSLQEYLDEMALWIAKYIKTNPEVPQEDVLTKRQELFDERKCKGWRHADWASETDIMGTVE